MIAANVAITLVVGSIFGFILSTHPPEWTALHLATFSGMIAAFALWTLARFQLGKALTVGAQARQLVSSGLYSKIRNPIYVFALTMLAGLILTVARPVWLLVFVALIPFVIWRSSVEAKVLAETFGEEYRKYRASTWF